MNLNSHICRFISENPNDWEEKIKARGITVKKDGDLAVFKYGLECDYFDPIVQEARGIIIDIKRLEVVCWPFRKFGNYTEKYADKIDWESARVLEKLDGAIIKLWYDSASSKWQFSTNGSIRAEMAHIDGKKDLSYITLIRSAENYNDLDTERLDRDKTYIFELVSPEQTIIIKYGKTKLYHIGTRNNITGEESDDDIGIEKPRSFPIKSFDDCITAALRLNENAKSDEVEREGFVVVDKSYNRIKVKSPDYIMMHRWIQARTIAKKDCVDILLNKRELIPKMMAVRDLIPQVKFYEYQLAYLDWQADKLGELAIKLSAEFNGDLSAVARIISKHRLSDVGFKCARSGMKGSEILKGYPIDKILKLIDDYEPEDLRKLFKNE